MSTTASSTCKLPLFDGAPALERRLLKCDLESHYVEALQGVRLQDDTAVKNILCTAWSILLRCYTGQDEVCFQLKQSSDTGFSHQPSLRNKGQSMILAQLDEHDTLTQCLARLGKNQSEIASGDLVPQVDSQAPSRPECNSALHIRHVSHDQVSLEAEFENFASSNPKVCTRWNSFMTRN